VIIAKSSEYVTTNLGTCDNQPRLLVSLGISCHMFTVLFKIE